MKKFVKALDMSPAAQQERREAIQARRDAIYVKMGQPIPQPKGTPTAAEISAGQIVREYKNAGVMQKDIRKMAAQGWRVQTQSSYQPSVGVGRVVALGIMAAVFRPKPRFTVIYTR